MSKKNHGQEKLRWCETMRKTKRLGRRLLMYYLVGRYLSMLNFAVSIIYRSLCPLPLMVLFRVDRLQYEKHKRNFKTSWKSGIGFSSRFRPFEEGWAERAKKDIIVGWTLKNYLGLSVQSVHICLVICLFIYFSFNFKDRATILEKEFPGPFCGRGGGGLGKGGVGWDSHINMAEKLVFSLGNIKCRFWS